MSSPFTRSLRRSDLSFVKKDEKRCVLSSRVATTSLTLTSLSFDATSIDYSFLLFALKPRSRNAVTRIPRSIRINDHRAFDMQSLEIGEGGEGAATQLTRR